MTDVHKFLALDLGAESGRGIIVTLADGKVSMEEIHRFANRPVRLAGTLTWDFPFLFAEVLESLRQCASRGVQPLSISVDTWGVDFGLLDGRGQLLANPVHYRDSRTGNIHEYSNRFMSLDEIFAATAYEPWAISSLFQLLSMQRDNSPLLAAADSFLNMPDLFNYFLTSVRANDMSIVNTSNLMSTECDWAEDVIGRFSLPRRIFGRLVPPASVLGPLTGEVCDQTGIGSDVPVVVSAGHDTSAAVAAVPASGDDWAYISCGTWSILGTMIDSPISTPRCLELGFTNEYTIGSWYLARNILGLWLVQELRRKWNAGGEGEDWSYDRLTAEASRAESGPLVDAADASLLAPEDMEAALLRLISRSGQAAPDGRGQLVRCALESLALEYNRRLDAVGQLTGHGHRPRIVYMVGGGTANKLLCQLTADACGVQVYAGADQCTAMGNALGQALAMGILNSASDLREVMRASFELVSYTPRAPQVWADRRGRYRSLCERG